jgi:SHS2 domain-containing protein
MGVRMTEWNDRSGKAHPRIEAEGANLTEAFREAARGFFGFFTDPGAIRPLERVVIYCESSDSDWLFSDWLNTLLYETRERRMVFSDFRVHVDGINVKGEIWGEPIDPARHPLKHDRVAGAAFDELFAIEEGGRARVSAVLNDWARHPLPLRELWEAGK